MIIASLCGLVAVCLQRKGNTISETLHSAELKIERACVEEMLGKKSVASRKKEEAENLKEGSSRLIAEATQKTRTDASDMKKRPKRLFLEA